MIVITSLTQKYIPSNKMGKNPNPAFALGSFLLAINCHPTISTKSPRKKVSKLIYVYFKINVNINGPTISQKTTPRIDDDR